MDGQKKRQAGRKAGREVKSQILLLELITLRTLFRRSNHLSGPNHYFVLTNSVRFDMETTLSKQVMFHGLVFDR